MSRVFPIACALALAVSIGWQLARPTTPGLGRVPVFTPASMGQAVEAGLCPGTVAQSAELAALRAIPLAPLLDALAREGRPPPALSARLEELAATQRAVLALRNQRHAWNVEAMERVGRLAAALEPAQLDWILSNRDRVAAEQLERTWQRLGVGDAP